MSRIEAAAKAVAIIESGDIAMTPVQGIDYTFAKAVLEAADAVMFSDEAVERAAKAEYDYDWEGVDVPAWEDEDLHVKDKYRDGIRVIIEALREET